MLDPLLSSPPRAGRDFLRGLGYPRRAFGFLAAHRLWPLAAASIAVNVLLLAALLAITFTVAAPRLEALGAAIVGWPEAEWLKGVMQGLALLVSMLVGVILIAANALVLLLVGQAVASPFLDMLSERVESLALGSPPQPFTLTRLGRAVVVALGDIVWGLLYLAAINLPILLIGWIPIVGQAAAGGLELGASALLFAQEFIGLPLTRYFIGYRGRFAEVWRNRWLSLGFGLVTLSMFVVPGLNLLLLPVAAVGGTLAYCDLRRAGRLAALPSDSAVPARR